MIPINKIYKPIIGMIHLDCLPGQPGFKGDDFLAHQALEDLLLLEAGGVDAVMVENWKDETPGPFISQGDIEVIKKLTKLVADKATVPVGINVLPNDYKAAFEIASEFGLGFVQLDVFVDHVKTDYSYSKVKPFDVIVDLGDFKKYKEAAGGVLLYATIHPKHYKMLQEKTLQQSALEAIANGADAIVVTGALTGKAPLSEKVKAVKEHVGDFPVYIGSGLNIDNAQSLLAYADGAIVGTAFKTPDFEKVELGKVEKMMKYVKSLHS